MRIQRNYQKEGEWKVVFAWLPIFLEEEIIWLEKHQTCWMSNPIGMVGWYSKPVDNSHCNKEG